MYCKYVHVVSLKISSDTVALTCSSKGRVKVRHFFLCIVRHTVDRGPTLVHYTENVKFSQLKYKGINDVL